MGYAVPLGGHSDPRKHNQGNTNSIFTSWTMSYGTAYNFSLNSGPGGVILQKKVKITDLIISPDLFNEGEWLMIGTVKADKVIKP